MTKKLKAIHKIAITLGDPQGIGPEITFKSLSHHQCQFPTIIIGHKNDYPDPDIESISSPDNAKECKPYFFHLPTSEHAKECSFEYVKAGVDWALKKKVSALVTAPISKIKWRQNGIKYNGHTPFLAHAVKMRSPIMFFYSDSLRVVLYTIHIPLRKIFPLIKKDLIVNFVRLVNHYLYEKGFKSVTFLLSGLNPHNGEEGILGDEELKQIIPAINLLKNEISILGPIPADVIFKKSQEIKDHIVVCWYHDQALPAFKLLHAHDGVNLTLGLPFVRTSPVHGTAFDIAGQDRADFGSMLAAILLAEKLVPNIV